MFRIRTKIALLCLWVFSSYYHFIYTPTKKNMSSTIFLKFQKSQCIMYLMCMLSISFVSCIIIFLLTTRNIILFLCKYSWNITFCSYIYKFLWGSHSTTITPRFSLSTRQPSNIILWTSNYHILFMVFYLSTQMMD